MHTILSLKNMLVNDWKNNIPPGNLSKLYNALMLFPVVHQYKNTYTVKLEFIKREGKSEKKSTLPINFLFDKL